MKAKGKFDILKEKNDLLEKKLLNQQNNVDKLSEKIYK